MTSLPPGQFELGYYPRFGLFQFGPYCNAPVPPLRLKLGGDVQTEVTLDGAFLHELPRIEQTCDQNCVTTWAQRGLNWSGVRFRDLYEQIVLPQVRPAVDARYVVLRADDGYRTYFLLEDIVADDVLLVDTLNGMPLDSDHGAPLRLVAPAHYAFRSAKHLTSIEFKRNLRGYHSPALHWQEHPRSRVAHEERGVWFPGWLYRYLYRPIVWPTIWNMHFFMWRAARSRNSAK
jgi:DMSO/TMAO reductase YedYZ molybdopterin-dependent catalytic subunit